jgi:V-type H+-transporting ATPase subunit E
LRAKCLRGICDTDTACSTGGVFVVGGGGKIELKNTFDERLRMCESDALPSIRATLFGENQNRRFHD